MKDWNRFYKAYKAYREQGGDVKVDPKLIVDGYELGNVVSKIRVRSITLTETQKKELDALGFDWTKRHHAPVRFNRLFQMLKEYKKATGDLKVPSSYVKNGVRLGEIVKNIKSGVRKITPQQREKLDSLGFVWKKERGGIAINKDSNTTKCNESNVPQTSSSNVCLKKGDSMKKKKKPKSSYYVFDTSIASEINQWQAKFDEIIKNKGKLVLTSVVLDELDSLQKRTGVVNVPEAARTPELVQTQINVHSVGARRLLARCAEDDDGHIVCVEIDAPTDVLHDNSIINYCQQTGYNLITADKVMACRAKMKGIHVVYITKADNTLYRGAYTNPVTENIGKVTSNDETTTSATVPLKPLKANAELVIPGVNYENGHLVINEFRTEDHFLKLVTPIQSHTLGPVELAKGDTVWSVNESASKNGNLIFRIFRIDDISSNNYCSLVNEFIVSSVDRVKSPSYREFVSDYLAFKKK